MKYLCDRSYLFHFSHIDEQFLCLSLMASAPSKPNITGAVVWEGSVNVSWIPVADTSQLPHNPGNAFLLEYKKAGMCYIALADNISFSLEYFGYIMFEHSSFCELEQAT